MSIGGFGFLNFCFNNVFLMGYLVMCLKDKWFGFILVVILEIIVFDFGGLNIVKFMYVGYLCFVVIGECLKWFLWFNGYDVVGDIYMGDWGK